MTYAPHKHMKKPETSKFISLSTYNYYKNLSSFFLLFFMRLTYFIIDGKDQIQRLFESLDGSSRGNCLNMRPLPIAELSRSYRGAIANLRCQVGFGREFVCVFCKQSVKAFVLLQARLEPGLSCPPRKNFVVVVVVVVAVVVVLVVEAFLTYAPHYA